MRQTFVIAAIMLWIVINILGNFADKQALLGQVDAETGLTPYQTLNRMEKPEIMDVDLGLVGKVGSFLITFGKILTLYHPALWQGTAVYIYYFLILPIGLSFWVVFVFMLRGVGSS